MNKLFRTLVAGSAAWVALLAGCVTSTDGGTPTGSRVATTGFIGSAPATTGTSAAASTTYLPIPTQDLDDALLRPNDAKRALESEGFPIGQWFASQGIGLPTHRVELCDKASGESVYLRDTLYWPAHTKLVASGMYVTVQESLLTGESTEIESIFRALKEGLTACLGVPQKSLLGNETLTSEPFEVATSADDHYATSYPDRQRIDVLFRDGAVMGHIVLTGISGDPSSADRMRALVTVAIEKLPPPGS